MLNSMVVKEAHKMAKEIKVEYPEVDYRFQYGLCLSYLLSVKKEEMKVMKGSEKQIKWANDIIENLRNTTKAELDRYTKKGIQKAIKDFSEVMDVVERIAEIEDAAKIINIAQGLNIFGSLPNAMDIKRAIDKGRIEEMLK